jgi:hypothetical protein
MQEALNRIKEMKIRILTELKLTKEKVENFKKTRTTVKLIN